MRGARRLRQPCTEGQARLGEGRVKCVGAVYEVETGRVRFLEPLVGRGVETFGRPLKGRVVTATRNDGHMAVRAADADFAMRVSPMALVLVLSASSVAGQTPAATQEPANTTQEVAGETPRGPAIVAGPTDIRIGGYLGLTGKYLSSSL